MRLFKDCSGHFSSVPHSAREGGVLGMCIGHFSMAVTTARGPRGSVYLAFATEGQMHEG